MIHRYLKTEAEREFPDFLWTINYYTGNMDTGTIFTEGGGNPDTYDFKWRYPEYMIFIRSSDWDKAELIAQKVYDLFHDNKDFRVEERLFVKDSDIFSDRAFYVQSLFALSEPIRLGVSDDKMEYSINIRATLREEN
ncbi:MULTISPECIES: minor capsid protein [Peribacillus]|uniref:minor capsid protein n=1 Tax=Peribacillus TaxID=2675229 RepID=UPI001F4DBDD6|nr:MULTISPECIES: minor capsid protein [unclassified Peribacillus]MCK1982230.1 minor capsid protein [Peribacillus sp. Aquil_B1]MCK2007418.1 minor capsid protein [Peribacillus sp. Aquil_B8]